MHINFKFSVYRSFLTDSLFFSKNLLLYCFLNLAWYLAQRNVSKTAWIIFAFSAAYIKKSDLPVRNQYYPFTVMDCSEMEDNFHCATSIFSPALFSSFAWLFAIIIIFRHLSRENPPRVFLPCILVAQPRSTWWMDYAENRWKKHREESKVLKRSSRLVMTAEITRNRKTNRVDYQRYSAVAHFRLLRILFLVFFQNIHYETNNMSNTL